MKELHPPLPVICIPTPRSSRRHCINLFREISIPVSSPSKSAHGAPVLFANKKDRSLHLCCDFHGKLNRVTKDRPLFLINDILGTSHKGCLYTKIDFRHAHLLHLMDGEEWRVAFRTKYSLFKWLVVPEGLTNALSIFQLLR